MEILFSILKEIVIFVLVGTAIVVLDSKVIVRLLVFLHPKESRPKREDAKGVTVRQSSEWQFWFACVVSGVLCIWYPAGVLEILARVLTLWVMFLAARPIVYRWDNRSWFFKTVGDHLTQDAPEIVEQGVQKLVGKTKPAPSVLDRFRGWFGRLVARRDQLKAEFAEIAQQYREEDPSSQPQTQQAPPVVEETQEERLARARRKLQGFSEGKNISEEDPAPQTTEGGKTE